MIHRSLSEVSASWDPTAFDDPAGSGIPSEHCLELGAELEEPGWLPLEDDKMFWGEEQPQSVASVLDTSPAETANTQSPGEKLQPLDSSFMSCGSSAGTMGRLMMLNGDEGMASPQQSLQPSKPSTESLLREVLVINGLPLEARATAMAAWMKKVQYYGGDFYNQCVQRAVGMLSTTLTSPLSSSDKGSGSLDQPTSSDSERSCFKRTRCEESELSPSSWRSFSGAGSKRHRTHTPGISSDYESEGGTFMCVDRRTAHSPQASHPFMINTPSTQTSRCNLGAQKFTLAEMDQQLGALMSDEPIWGDMLSLSTDTFNYPNLSLPSKASQKIDTPSWETPAALQIDDVAPGEDLPPCFMQALYTMCNDGAQLVDL